MAIWVENVKGTIWGADKQDKYVKARLSTAEKNKQTDEWVNSSWFVKFIGKAKERAESLTDKDRITVLKGKMTNTYNKDTKKSFMDFVIFDFEMAESNQYAPTDYSKQDADGFMPVDVDDDLPF